jgi:putative oxidoreductase
LADVNSLGKYSGHFYALLRIVVGLLFACHGAQKLLGMFGGKGLPSDPLMLVGGVIELAGGFLIAFGLLTRPAAFLASGMMAVAYFMVHASGKALGHPASGTEMFFPLLNKGEPAVVYCFVFLYIFFRGGGLWSLDSLIFGGRAVAADEVGGPARVGHDL